MHLTFEDLTRYYDELANEHKKLQARHAKLLDAIIEAQGVICSEYCGTDHHAKCKEVSEAIEADAKASAEG